MMKIFSVLLFLSVYHAVSGQVLVENLSLGTYSDQANIQALRSITLTNGFHIPAGRNVQINIAGAQNLISKPSIDQNYILTRTYRIPVKQNELAASRSIGEENQNIQYFDGLGRLSQTIDLMASPGYNDIVQYIEYDSLGRESKKYLPYAEKPGNTGYNDVSFKSTAKTRQSLYYAATGSWDTHIIKTAYPYAITVFDDSPMGRIVQQGAAGEAWQPYSASLPASGHTSSTEYGVSKGEEVSLWHSYPGSGEIVKGPPYFKNNLSKITFRDENWTSGKAGTTEEFKDLQGRVILKRVWETDVKKLDTYYVYDNLGNLLYVIPHAATDLQMYKSYKETDPLFDEYIYAYHYDLRNRVVERKVPGKGWEWLIYNDNDQVILSQDARQRVAHKWSYTKYDALGRVTSTGIYTNTLTGQTTRQQVQALADASIELWESRATGSATYSNVAFPNTASQLTEHTVNYYDDYLFSGASGTAMQAVGITQTQQTLCLVTGSKVNRDDGTAPLLTVNYYDDKGQIIQQVSQNHLGGIDMLTNEYNFTGELTKTTRLHTGKGTAMTTIGTTNIYDHMGRLLSVKNYVNDALTEVTLVNNEYNEIGQLRKKSLGGDKNGNNYLAAVSIGYNERGWLTGASSPFFSYQLGYHTGSNGATLSNAQYNGNIAQQLWGHGASMTSTFTYSYDRLNRLVNGTSSGTTIMSEALTYDEMGNIRTLSRNIGNTTSTGLTTYTYQNSNKSNRLASLTGAISGQFAYDANGNATKDRTGMTIGYNHLNLPDTVYNTGGTIKVGFLYDANGNKLKKYTNVGDTRDYIEGIEYGGNNIDFIHTGVGVAYRNANGTYSYRYNLTDHLGNIRSTIYRNPATGVVEVLQKTDYYAFGKSRIVAGGNNKYLYNGKEIQDDLGGGTHSFGSSYQLEGQYDYGARFYDAEIGRWNVVDPMASEAYDWSPYRYGYNNPMKFIDPTGMLEDDYTVDDFGKINLVRKTDDDFDRLIKVDKDGNETDQNIQVAKGILNNVKSDLTLSNIEYNYLRINNSNVALSLFEFLAKNTKVEWSLIKAGRHGNYISTSHEEYTERGSAHMTAKLFRDRIPMSEHIHSHPGWTTKGPSGYALREGPMESSDRLFAEAMSRYSPRTILKVFRVYNQTYTRYDKDKIYP